MILEYPKRVTLKDIARSAKLSVAAVSMALRNHASLPATTINRVKKIADELGYRPDPALSALAAHRCRLQSNRSVSVIALVSNWSTRDGWLNSPGAKELFDNASARATSLGFDLQHFWAREHGGFSPRLSSVLDARGIKSVILAPAQSESVSTDISWDPFTVVSLEPPPIDVILPHVGINHFANVVRCWHELTARGFQRVGLITRDAQLGSAQGQCIAAHTFSQSRTASPFDQVPDLTLGTGNDAAQIASWLKEHRPQAVIASTPVHHLIEQELDILVPEEISYVSLNVTAEKRADISGIDSNIGMVGETVVDTLNQLLQRGITGCSKSPVGTHVSGAWQEGTSLRAPVQLAKSG
ncbi:MAG: hypothetical protein SynsKO_21550 [Synoicihabitans sp.]